MGVARGSESANADAVIFSYLCLVSSMVASTTLPIADGNSSSILQNSQRILQNTTNFTTCAI